MKKALLKDSFKEIKKSYKRFLSILLMALLGVGFFCGLRASSPDMKATIDSYFDKCNFFDIQVLSTLGLTDDDIKALEEIEGIEKAYPVFSKDVKLIENNLEYILNLTTLTNEINKVKIVQGEEPKNSNECLVEDSLLTDLNKNIGDTINIQEELKEDEEASLVNTELKIVGAIQSPMYISRERGTSSLGSGKIDYYIYVPDSNISSDVYTSIYAKVASAKELNTTADEYTELIDSVKEKIEQIEDTQKQRRYDELIGEANQKLDDAQKELDTEKADAESKIQEAEDEINSNEKKLNDAQSELNSNKTKANNEFAKAKEEIENAKKTLDESKKELETKKAEAEEGFKQAEEQKASLEEQLATLTAGLTELQTRKQEIEDAIKNQGEYMTEEQLAEAKYQLSYIEGQISELEQNKTKLEAGIQEIKNQISSGKTELETAENQINNGYKEIEENEKTLNSQINQTNKELEDAQNEINSGKEEIEEAKQTLEESKQEFNEKITEAESKLIDAREEVAEIEKPEWYIWDRNDNQGYSSYISDSDNMSKIANVFQAVFFIIAALISLTSMTRMVEEQRGIIGTLKALGYSSISISVKYILYATLATVIGAIIGMNIGFQFLPRIVISLYQMMYPYVSEHVIEFNYFYAGLGLGLISICNIGATIYAVQKELKSTPAELMRPKAPKSGKRVLLEKITFIWKHLSFTQKVTVRNMFRYKKRFIMTIAGISGCTALILVGFGIKDSIAKIMHFQYENIYEYNATISLKSNLEESELQELQNKLLDMSDISAQTEVYLSSTTLVSNTDNRDAQIVVPKDIEEIDQAIHLNDSKTKEKIKLDNDTILITEKLADLLEIKEGDIVELEDSEHNKYSLKVGSIVEQYLEHYVYMSKELYEKTFNEPYKSNVIYINYSSENIDENTLISELLKDSRISTAIGTNKVISSVDDMLTALNSVVYILIISAGLLAFVVLYNLSNINISERIRELATIKVLGFYDKEVYDYVAREVIILTIIGILLGLVGGYFLSNFIISTCETEALRFPRVIQPQSYLYSALLTIVFTIIVNIATYFALKKIDMIESLKSVE